MTRILTTATLLIIAVVIFFVFTDPLITNPITINAEGQMEGGVLALQQERKIFKTALADARSLKNRINDLDTKLASIPSNQISRLDDFLPDTMDEIQLIVDISRIAALSGMTIRDINVVTESKNQRNGASAIDLANPELQSLSLSFSTTGSYSQFKIFAANIAKSLRIMDIKTVSFSTDPASATITYNVELTTYWIK